MQDWESLAIMPREISGLDSIQIGVPEEIKVHEYRVGLTPASVRELTMAGHTVLIEKDAGAGIGCLDIDYRNAGADIAPDALTVFRESECIVKVKEPQLNQCAVERADLVIGSMLVPGAAAPKLVDESLIAKMLPGSLLSISPSITADASPRADRQPMRVPHTFSMESSTTV